MENRVWLKSLNLLFNIRKHCGKRRKMHEISPLTLPKQQILDFSKLKEFAGDNFKFDDNGRKFSKHVENTVGKGEIACYKQFLLFPRCFQWTCTADT